jgi:hypothetical protein
MNDPHDPYRSGYPEPPEVPGVPSGPPTVPYPASYPVNPYPPQDPYAVSPYPVQYSDPYAAQAYSYAPQYSDKSKVTAGLLQLLLGMCLTLGGVGRLYAGHMTIGVIQICASGVAWLLAICAAFTFGFTLLFVIPIWLWFVIDGIVMLVGRPVDGQGRLLRS